MTAHLGGYSYADLGSALFNAELVRANVHQENGAILLAQHGDDHSYRGIEV